MKNSIIITAIIAISISTSTVSAQANRGLQDEKTRIQQGVSSGELSKAESARLRGQTANLKAEAFRYKANDGRISRRERADLRRDNSRLNRNITCQKHDRQKRF
jgi:hypothetical protein